MALNISAWSIRQPLPALVMAAAIIGIGCLGFQKIPITRMPNIDVPAITVTITQFGAAPAELETQVAKKVEDAVAVTKKNKDPLSVDAQLSAALLLMRLELAGAQL